jgi:hypothetical protein
VCGCEINRDVLKEKPNLGKESGVRRGGERVHAVEGSKHKAEVDCVVRGRLVRSWGEEEGGKGEGQQWSTKEHEGKSPSKSQCCVIAYPSKLRPTWFKLAMRIKRVKRKKERFYKGITHCIEESSKKKECCKGKIEK